MATGFAERPISVLIVDAHDALREALSHWLQSDDRIAVVGEVGTADEAIHIAFETKPNVILMEIDLPRCQCFDAVRRIRAKLPTTEVLFLSAHTNDGYIEDALKVEALGYITKSEKPERVLEAVLTVAKGSFFFSPEVRARIIIEGNGARLAMNTSRTTLLSPREFEVLRYIAQGLSKKQIADIIGMSPKTVDNQASSLMSKLDLHNRADLTRYALNRYGYRSDQVMFERFTDRARKIMALANLEAQRFNHECLGTEHILLGLAKEGSGVGAKILKDLDVQLRKVRLEVEKLIKAGHEMVTMGKLPQTARAKKVIEYAVEEARALNNENIGSEHLLLGMLREQDGVAFKALTNLGVTLEDAREELSKKLNRPTPVQTSGDSSATTLDQYGTDLTSHAMGGGFAATIRREDEVDRLVRILCRADRSNPILIGNRGIGKKSIVNGLARRIAAADVPAPLLSTRLIRHDWNFAQDSQVCKQQEDARIKAIRIASRDPDTILFVPDLPLHASAQEWHRPFLDAAIHGCIRFIGTATSMSHSTQHDGATRLRDGSVCFLKVKPMGKELVLRVVELARPRLEAHHCVNISDAAVAEAARIASESGIGGNAISATELMDEACSRVTIARATPAQNPRLQELHQELYELLSSRWSDNLHGESKRNLLRLKRERKALIAEHVDLQRALMCGFVVDEEHVRAAMSAFSNGGTADASS